MIWHNFLVPDKSKARQNCHWKHLLWIFTMMSCVFPDRAILGQDADWYITSRWTFLWTQTSSISSLTVLLVSTVPNRYVSTESHTFIWAHQNQNQNLFQCSLQHPQHHGFRNVFLRRLITTTSHMYWYYKMILWSFPSIRDLPYDRYIRWRSTNFLKVCQLRRP